MYDTRAIDGRDGYKLMQNLMLGLLAQRGVTTSHMASNRKMSDLMFQVWYGSLSLKIVPDTRSLKCGHDAGGAHSPVIQWQKSHDTEGCSTKTEYEDSTTRFELNNLVNPVNLKSRVLRMYWTYGYINSHPKEGFLQKILKNLS